MASIQREILVGASAETVWDAVRDVGALHTRLVPGFVVDTQLKPGERVVTFANGLVAREPIVSLDENARRLVWTSISERLSHYNAAVQVFDADGSRTKIVWTVDLLPDEAAQTIATMMDQGINAMKRAFHD